MEDTADYEKTIDSSLIKLAEQYASCDRRSAEINDERKTIRDNAEKLGIPSKAFQHAVGMVKHMSEGERRDYQVGVNRVLKAISDRQNDLFPQEAERIRKRVEAQEAEQAAAAAAKGPDPDTNPRSDPNRGGAKPQIVVDNSAEVGAGAAQLQAEEQATGEQVLAAGLKQTRKKSQSQESRERLEAAGLSNTPAMVN